MMKIPEAKVGVYAGLLDKITSYQDRLSVRYVMEKLLISDSQCAAVDHDTIRDYLSPATIHLLLMHDFILKHETSAGIYYELSNDELIRELEGYARKAANRNVFDNEPLVQIALKAWRRSHDKLERDQSMQRLFMKIRKEREAQLRAFFYVIIVPGICIVALSMLIFTITHMVE